MRRTLRFAPLAALALVLSAAPAAPPLDLTARIAAQRALAAVYARHRGPGAAVPDDAVLEAQVRCGLAEEAALAALYGVRIDAAMLRAEAARVARSTRLPGRLRELYAALGDDPRTIGECLLRPLLAGRLLRAQYAQDAAPRRPAAVPARRGRQVPHALAAGPADRAARPAFGAWWDGAQRAFDAVVPSAPAAGLDALPPLAPQGSKSCNEWRNGTLDDVPDARSGHTAIWTGSEMIVWGGGDDVGGSLGDGAAYDPALDSWHAISRVGAPTPRLDHTAVWTGTKMIVWGGAQAQELIPVTATGGFYDPASDAWTATSTTNAATARAQHTAIWTGTKMYVWGGYTATLSGTSDLASGAAYDPLTDAWTALPASALHARSRHTAVWTGTSMVIFGGYSADASGNVTNYGDGARYTPGTGWAALPATGAPAARAYHTATWTGTAMVVFGGNATSVAGDTTDMNDGAVWTPATGWTPTSTGTGVPSVRSSHSAVWDAAHGRVLVWGGDANDQLAIRHALADGAAYDPAANAWITLPSTGQAARSGHTAVFAPERGAMIVWGGEQFDVSGFAAPLASGGRYDAVGGTWLPTATGLAPEGRFAHSAVWTGSEMVVWGGADGVSVRNDGARYDPALDTWHETSTGLNVPAPRSGHGALWTGSRMLVWGGSGNVGTLASGGRYDPATDAWQTVSGTGAPSARRGHTTVWTGTRALIWGGYGGSTVKADGAAYDPDGDAWKPIGPAPSSIAGRLGHTAVWTGSAMLVWGGQTLDTSGVIDLADGASYDPVADTWSVLPTANAPSARSAHTATWTGGVMVVWGGSHIGASSDLKSGARYNPSPGNWTATSSTGAPDGRSGHTAVWTGDEVLIWGGANSLAFGAAFDDGARYDAKLNAWTAMPQAGAPPGREAHTAVFDGQEMIVWGGTDSTMTRRSGGRYTPQLSRDADSDSYSVCAGDCNDDDPSVHPGATELCSDGIDNDCNGLTDAADPACTVAPCPDADGDAYAVCVPACALSPGKACGDCDDAAAAVHPGAVELCGDGADNDCNGLTDVADPACAPPECPDADADGYRTCSAQCTEPPGATCGDCDDTRVAVHPGAPEVCNAVDDDCDGSIDEGVLTTFYRDADGDGYGNAARTAQACTAPGGYVADASDCDDAQAGVHPGAAEACNGVDDDCDGSIDEGVQSTFHRDADADGFGAAGVTTEACTAPAGYVTDASDCDDAQAGVHPGAAEACNGVDDDCDAATADGAAEPWLGAVCDGPDADLCAEGTFACTSGGQACTDATDDSIEGPAAPGSCSDGVDNDCDAATDGADAGCASLPACPDADGDGWAECGAGCAVAGTPCGDCDDAQAGVHPGAAEACNGVDDDCNAATADGAGEAWLGAACDGPDADLCAEGALACSGAAAACSDTTGDTIEGRGAPGSCSDGIDNDCDGSIDLAAIACFGPSAPAGGARVDPGGAIPSFAWEGAAFSAMRPVFSSAPGPAGTVVRPVGAYSRKASWAPPSSAWLGLLRKLARDADTTVYWAVEAKDGRTVRTSAALPLVVRGVRGAAPSAPDDGAPAAASGAAPAFAWSAGSVPARLAIEFAASPAFSGKVRRHTVKASATGYRPSASAWKAIAALPGAGGGTVYWRVTTTDKLGRVATGAARSLVIAP